MIKIASGSLDDALHALGDHLALAGHPLSLVVIGGSGLIAIGAVSRATRDVDVVAIRRDGKLISAEPLPEILVQAARTVARDFNLEPNWLNAGPTRLMEIGGLPDGFVERLHPRAYGPALTVAFASRVDQIYFKVYAAADRDMPRDLTDLKALEPTEPELHAAAQWARTHNMPGPFDDAVAAVLSQFDVQDAGRDA